MKAIEFQSTAFMFNYCYSYLRWRLRIFLRSLLRAKACLIRRFSPGFRKKECRLTSLIISSCCTFRLNRRSAFSRLSPSFTSIYAKKPHLLLDYCQKRNQSIWISPNCVKKIFLNSGLSRTLRKSLEYFSESESTIFYFTSLGRCATVSTLLSSISRRKCCLY